MEKTILIIIICLNSLLSLYSQESNELMVDYNPEKKLYGYINKQMELIVDYQLSYADLFYEGLALVENDLKFGYINEKGVLVISQKFADAGPFSNGLAYFSEDNKKYGYIDKSGNVVIEPKFDKALEFNNEYAIVFKSNLSKTSFTEGIIDKSGNLIGNQWFTSVDAIYDSVAKVRNKENNYYLNLINGRLLETSKIENQNKPIYFIVDVMPEFPGRELALRKYISQNVRYPESARKNKIEGTTYIRFSISETGEVSNFKISRSAHPLLDKESVRVVKSLPCWKPGTQKGKPVSVWYTVPINFQLNP